MTNHKEFIVGKCNMAASLDQPGGTSSSDLPGFRRNALPAGEDAIRHNLFYKKDL